ncbi:TlpA family protein disulfide reductase [Winogradskyella marincola]|uniref:TlpA disulfide reductase family protein n=1 Tax=Winogradskyella marincola TaxID=3037795 RepID=A0ABT6G091_9FLAO|nr:TlpA disulfide reductase family protein [Winogradskyella sp. YYF002]MDG4715461.1 TlpA disulfide reductase family protein [Winogradskyella sp. YYF002]
MKRLLTLSIVTTLFACKEEPKIDYVLFSGKIENPTVKSVSVFQGREKIKEIQLEQDGTFSDTLTVENGYYNLDHGREVAYMYLEKGDSINVSLDTKEFDETIKYSGIGSGKNNFLAEKILIEEKADIDISKVYAMEEPEFIAVMEDLKNSKVKSLESKENLSSEFKTTEKKNIDYDYLINLLNYPSYHKHFAKKAEFKASDDFMTRFSSIDYNNSKDYEALDSYKRLVQSHYAKKLRDSDNPSLIFDEVSNAGIDDLKEDFSKSLRYDISPSNENLKAFYDGIMKLSSDEKYKEEITAKYDKVSKLAKGMPSPAFVEYENHKGGTTSLKDLKGKYVYVDVWATWCGPCIREIPSLKEVEKQFHGKNIAFVSTSIDKASAHNTWVEMVKNKELGGIQLMADNDWNSQFVKDYAIEGIPRFILIDPDGNIVSADAPRPSNPKLVELFKELNI